MKKVKAVLEYKRLKYFWRFIGIKFKIEEHRLRGREHGKGGKCTLLMFDGGGVGS